MTDNGKSLATVDSNTMMELVAGGDMSKLKPEQKLAYYRARCEAAGLDPRTVPFQLLKLQGREVLYALKGATDQLASIHKVKTEIISQVTEDGVRTVVVRAVAQDGRATDEIGVVNVNNLAPADLANAYMKAVTKAKRRAILSLCGLGMMDETEIETIPGAAPVPLDPAAPARASAGVVETEATPTAGRKISTDQAKRFYAIWMNAKKTREQVNAYLMDTLGIKRDSEMLVEDFEAACAWAAK